MSFAWFPAWALEQYPRVDREDFVDSSCAIFNLDPTGNPAAALAGIAGYLEVRLAEAPLDVRNSVFLACVELAANCCQYAELIGGPSGMPLHKLEVMPAGRAWLADYKVWMDKERRGATLH